MEKELLFLKYDLLENKFYCLDKYNVNFEEIEIEFRHNNDIAVPPNWYIELKLRLKKETVFNFDARGIREGNKIILDEPFITFVTDDEFHNDKTLAILVKALGDSLTDG